MSVSHVELIGLCTKIVRKRISWAVLVNQLNDWYILLSDFRNGFIRKNSLALFGFHG